MDTYRTIATAGEAVFTEKRSRFLAFAHHVETAEEAKTIVAALKKKYYDARHVCWAYALGNDGGETRSNDDGEPSGTAGRPILGQLRSADVTQTLVAVVRYFGGVKLGTGGLVVAYKTAASLALEAAVIEERSIEVLLKVFAPFEETDRCLRLARNLGAEVKNQEYTAEGVSVTFSIRQSLEQDLRQAMASNHKLRIQD